MMFWGGFSALLGRCLLLAHAHQLVVDLLRCLDAIGRLRIGTVCGRLRGGGWDGRGRCCGAGFRLFLRFGTLGSFFGVASFVEDTGVGVGRRSPSLTWGEDELRGRGAFAMDQEHIAAGAVEQGGENLRGSGRAVVSEDALFGDSSGDLHAGFGGDLAEDLVEAGVVRRDREEAVRIDHLRVFRLG